MSYISEYWPTFDMSVLVSLNEKTGNKESTGDLEIVANKTRIIF